MAAINIEERRAYVKSLVDAGAELTREQIKEIAARFSAKVYQVNDDIKLLRYGKGVFVFKSSPLRKVIPERDGQVCQYCGVTDWHCYDIEHVVPANIGGPAQSYNLVIACCRCNSRKGGSVWIPNNLDAITKDNPEWAEKVRQMADEQKRYIVKKYRYRTP